jgi:hypothetical protein
VPIYSYFCEACDRGFDRLEVVGCASVRCGCGSLAGREYGSFGLRVDRTSEVSPSDLDPLELQMVLENRRDLEASVGRRDSGEITVRESGPDWSRPFGNRAGERRFF